MSITLYLLIALGFFFLAVPLINAAIVLSERMADRRPRPRRPPDEASCH
jgi:hypothetical protein